MNSKENFCHICKNKCENTLCKECYVPLFTPIEHHVSFAFLDIPEEIEYSALSETIVLDCFKSGLVKAEISQFFQLRQLRLSHCSKLTKINLTDLHSLISLDAYDIPNLVEATFTNVPNLISLDLSFCPKLPEIKGEFQKVEYFNISHTEINILPQLPSVKFLDISSTKITDISLIYTFQKLQRLIMLDNKSIDTIEIGKLAQNPDFTSIISPSQILDFNGCPTNHQLKNIHTHNKLINAETVDFSKTNIFGLSSITSPHLTFENPLNSGDWYDSYRLIYGPYPTPPNDSKPFLTETEIESLYNVYHLPQEVDPTLVSHHITGSLFGSSIGDCLGMHTEGSEPLMINMFVDQPLDITWTHPVTSSRGTFFHRGSFTDDTALILVFLRSVVSTALLNLQKDKDDVANIFDANDAGKRIKHWVKCGIDEHLDGLGIGYGRYTKMVVDSKGYLEDVLAASKKCWKRNRGKNKAFGNGGVMRTAGCGCFLFWDEKKVIEISRRFCQVTHYDPLCVFSSVLVSLLISRLLQWRVGLAAGFDLDSTIEEVKSLFEKKDDSNDSEDNDYFIEDFNEIDSFVYASEIEELNILSNSPATLCTLACAVWVLRKDFGYAEGIEKVVRAGGDTDTNAACAGAVLGAKWGIEGIPLHLLDFFWYGGIVHRDVAAFLNMMGIQLAPPTYEDLVGSKGEKE